MVATVVALLATACTSGSESTNDTTSTTAAVTTTTTPPVLLGLTVDLELLPEQCWADIPEAPTTTTEPDEQAPSTTSDGPPEPLPATSTTVAAPEVVAQVACEGTHDGRAFAVFCLGSAADAPETDDSNPTTTLSDDVDLIEVPCPAEGRAPNLEWPGDRVLRRAASTVCLTKFEVYFNERYSLSPLVAREFTPTEGAWDQGERRVVCTVDALPEPVPDADEVTS